MLILRKRNAPFGFNGCQAQRPIGAGAGENHTDGLAFSVLGQRAKKSVDHHAVMAILGLRGWMGRAARRSSCISRVALGEIT